MNRAQRRAAAQAARRSRDLPSDRAAVTFAGNVECPDCDADTALIEQAPGVYTVRVAHDPSCPTYRGIR